jgi:imidazoleglycerol phosphate synthase glutamine amidotransferase subunit HisH
VESIVAAIGRRALEAQAGNATLDCVLGPCSAVEGAAMQAAFHSLGRHLRPWSGVEDLRLADAVVLPWCACHRRGARRFEELGLAEAVRERIERGRATLVVGTAVQVVGAGILGEHAPGLEAVDVRAERGLGDPEACAFEEVATTGAMRFVRPGRYAFQKRYRVPLPPAGWASAYAEDGRLHVAALERGQVLLTQFRPELSGAAGLDVLSRWCAAAEAGLRGAPRPFGAREGAGLLAAAG